MTQLYLFGGSIAAVVLLALAARLFGLGGGALADAAEARDTAEATLSGFAAGRVWLDRDRQAALVEGEGEVAVLRRHGARFVARRLSLPAQAGDAGPVVTIASGERLLGPFVITLANDAEARELTSMLVSPRRA